ncbi:hypothetical protein ACVWY3_000431 [Bradyrhizobium sp. USDA 4486]
MLAQVAGAIEPARLDIDIFGRDRGRAASVRMASVTSSTEFASISWMNEMFWYSPETTREMISRRVISGSTIASRPRPP